MVFMPSMPGRNGYAYFIFYEVIFMIYYILIGIEFLINIIFYIMLIKVIKHCDTLTAYVNALTDLFKSLYTEITKEE